MIKELQKEKIKIRKKNPARSVVLGNLIEGAKKRAKENNREPNESDVISTAKKIIKTLSKVLEGMESGTLADSYLNEIKICKEFLPALVDEKTVSNYIDKEISLLDEKSMKSMGKIIKSVKSKFGDTIDMSYVSKVVKGKLS